MTHKTKSLANNEKRTKRDVRGERKTAKVGFAVVLGVTWALRAPDQSRLTGHDLALYSLTRAYARTRKQPPPHKHTHTHKHTHSRTDNNSD